MDSSIMESVVYACALGLGFFSGHEFWCRHRGGNDESWVRRNRNKGR